MGAGEASNIVADGDLVRRIESFERAVTRRRKLQAMFNDASFLDKALRQGRYLRLCAAIAWASEREERVRTSIETDLMVGHLRKAIGRMAPVASRTLASSAARSRAAR